VKRLRDSSAAAAGACADDWPAPDGADDDAGGAWADIVAGGNVAEIKKLASRTLRMTTAYLM
jgi:hypothetical protein